MLALMNARCSSKATALELGGWNIMLTNFTNYFAFTTGWLDAGAHDCVLQPGSDRHEGDAEDHDNDMVRF